MQRVQTGIQKAAVHAQGSFGYLDGPICIHNVSVGARMALKATRELSYNFGSSP